MSEHYISRFPLAVSGFRLLAVLAFGAKTRKCALEWG